MYRPVVFATGMFIAGLISKTGSRGYFTVFILAIFYSLFYMKEAENNFKYCLWSIILSLIFISFFAFGKIQSSQFNVKTQVQTVSENSENVKVIGVVVDINTTDNGYKVIISVKKLIAGDGNSINVTNNEKLILYSEQSVSYGDEIEFWTNIQLFKNTYNEGGFDAGNYYFARNISGYAYPDNITILSTDNCQPIAKVLNSFKIWLNKGLRLIYDENQSGVLIAILTGDRTYINEDIRQIYQDTGFAHILAISGLHISIIGLSFFNFLRKRQLGYVPATIFTLLVLCVYNSFSGGQVSCKRAVIMICVSLVARCTGKKYDSITALALAALILLINQPYYIYDSSFLMSFSAGFGSAFFGRAISKIEILAEKRWSEKIKNLLFSLSIQVSLLPCQVEFFNKFCPYSILLNLILLPFVSIVVIGGFVSGVVANLFITAGEICALPVKIILELYELVLSKTGNLPFSSILTGHMTMLKWIVVLLILLSFYIIGRYSKQIYVFWSFIPAVILISPLHNNQVIISQLYVGQGDCCIITFGKTAIAIDCGSSDEKDLYEYTVKPFLNYNGYDKLDYIFLSHADEDHVSGIREYLSNVDELKSVEETIIIVPQLEDNSKYIKNLGLNSDIIDKSNISLKQIQCFETVKIGDIVFTCVFPDEKNNIQSENESSMVLHMQYKDFTMLFTGDISSENEMNVIKNLKFLDISTDVDVLKVAHHGSRYSTCEDFLEVVNPEIGVISCGIDNIYNHPAVEAVERLTKYTVELYVTSKKWSAYNHNRWD